MYSWEIWSEGCIIEWVYADDLQTALDFAKLIFPHKQVNVIREHI
jgi:hypothetical protein